MTKNEALKKCIDGAKICHEDYRPNNFIYFDGEKFILTNGDVSTNAGSPAFALAHKDGWKIVPEYVDFATAWKAHEEGKTIQSVINSKPFDTYKKSEDTNRGIFTDEIRGKWLILEDE